MSMVSPAAMESRCYPEDLEAGPLSSEDAKCCGDESTVADDNSLSDVASAVPGLVTSAADKVEDADVLDGRAMPSCVSARSLRLSSVWGQAAGAVCVSLAVLIFASKPSVFQMLRRSDEPFDPCLQRNLPRSADTVLPQRPCLVQFERGN